MSSLQRRQLRREDAEDVARLFVAGWGDLRRMDAGDICEWFDNEALKPSNLLVLVEDDRVVGYFDVWPEGETADLDLAAPGFWGQAMDHAEDHARVLGAKRARTFVAEDHELVPIVRARDYRTIRTSWTMEIELGLEAPAEPVVPAGVEIRPYRHPDDEQRVFDTVQDAFADHWDFRPDTIENWREFMVRSRTFDPDLWLVAWGADDVAGVSLNQSERAGDPGYGWVATLGVRRKWRRRGLGEALLRRSFAALHGRGLRKVRLSVDAENPTGATRLYERAGMSVLHRFDRWEREL
ncbi:MAG: mycothiol synthase [Gaiellaceae bacterium]|jgi:mycothiol synthase|nr:mycothiol synthase [Gaiellaceae bacterium]